MNDPMKASDRSGSSQDRHRQFISTSSEECLTLKSWMSIRWGLGLGRPDPEAAAAGLSNWSQLGRPD